MSAMSRARLGLERASRPRMARSAAEANATAEHRRIVDLAAKSRLPAMYNAREFVEAGGQMAYGANIADGERDGPEHDEAGRRSGDKDADSMRRVQCREHPRRFDDL